MCTLLSIVDLANKWGWWWWWWWWSYFFGPPCITGTVGSFNCSERRYSIVRLLVYLMNMQAVSSGGSWCLEDEEDMEVLLSRCMAKTTCTPPVHSKPLKSCHRSSHSDFVIVEYRCISGEFWTTYHRSNFHVFLLAPRATATTLVGAGANPPPLLILRVFLEFGTPQNAS